MIAAFLLAAVAAAPLSPEAHFDRGYAAYEAGRFDEAAAAFSEAIDAGARDPRVEYNLGNAEYRRGRIGPAILHWERALRLDPSDADAAANLALARERTVDRIEVPAPTGVVAAIRAAQDAIGLDAQGMIALLLFWAAAGIVVFRGGRPGGFTPGWGWILAAILAALTLLCVSFGTTLARVEGRDRAIVLAPAVAVLSGPSETNATVFRIHEGTAVEIRESRGDWVRILLPTGLNGWVPRDSIEPI